MYIWMYTYVGIIRANTNHTRTQRMCTHTTHTDKTLHTRGREGARAGSNLEIDHSDDLAILYRRQAHACMH